MFFVIVLTIVLVVIFTMVGRMINFFGKTSYPKNVQASKSKHSAATDKDDSEDKWHTFFRNCDKATTEPVTGDITGRKKN